MQSCLHSAWHRVNTQETLARIVIPTYQEKEMSTQDAGEEDQVRVKLGGV